MAKKAESLFESYYKATDNFIEETKVYTKFKESLAKGENRSAVLERFVDKNVDIIWIDKIEDSIIALDNIIRAPRNFIKEEEEIVPIALSKKITSESVKHLSQHTNMIQNIEGDRVTPSKILNVFKEESFGTYENKFIKTLLTNLSIFIDRRYRGLNAQKDVNNVQTTRSEQIFEIGNEKIKYAMEISVQTPSSKDPKEKRTNEDVVNDIDRVERIRTIIGDFMKSDFMVKLKDFPLVRPPIQKTNLLTKNQDYKKALELWQFIESYRDAGFSVALVEDSTLAIPDYQEQLNRSAFFEYLLLKRFSNQDTSKDLDEENVLDEDGKVRYVDVTSKGGGKAKKVDETNSSILKRTFRSILGNYDDNLMEVKNIFVSELEKRSKAIEQQELKISQAIERCIQRKNRDDRAEALKEKKRIAELALKERKRKEREEKKALELAKKEEEKRLKEEEAARKKEEALKLAEEKRLAREAKKAESDRKKAEAELKRQQKAKELEEKNKEKIDEEKALEEKKAKDEKIDEKERLQDEIDKMRAKYTVEKEEEAPTEETPVEETPTEEVEEDSPKEEKTPTEKTPEDIPIEEETPTEEVEENSPIEEESDDQDEEDDEDDDDEEEEETSSDESSEPKEKVKKPRKSHQTFQKKARQLKKYSINEVRKPYTEMQSKPIVEYRK